MEKMAAAVKRLRAEKMAAARWPVAGAWSCFGATCLCRAVGGGASRDSVISAVRCRAVARACEARCRPPNRPSSGASALCAFPHALHLLQAQSSCHA